MGDVRFRVIHVLCVMSTAAHVAFSPDNKQQVVLRPWKDRFASRHSTASGETLDALLKHMHEPAMTP